MKILRSTKDLTTKDQYNLTMSPKIQKMSAHKGEVLDVAKFCIYEDVDKENNPRTILSLMTDKGDILATNSATFMADFERILDLLNSNGEDIATIEVVSGQSKSGREFITCALV